MSVEIKPSCIFIQSRTWKSHIHIVNRFGVCVWSKSRSFDRHQGRKSNRIYKSFHTLFLNSIWVLYSHWYYQFSILRMNKALLSAVIWNIHLSDKIWKYFTIISSHFLIFFKYILNGTNKCKPSLAMNSET